MNLSPSNSKDSGMRALQDENPPRFFSISFHLRFFPVLLWGSLRRKRPGREAPFAHHAPLEFTVFSVLSAASAVYGLQVAITNDSLTGWIFGIAGLVVFSGLLVASIVSASGIRPSYESFSVRVFLFFVMLGATAGLMSGKIAFSETGVVPLLLATGGFVAGYLAGIISGYWIQRLGWIASFFETAALLGIPGLAVVDIVIMVH